MAVVLMTPASVSGSAGDFPKRAKRQAIAFVDRQAQCLCVRRIHFPGRYLSLYGASELREIADEESGLKIVARASFLTCLVLALMSTPGASNAAADQKFLLGPPTQDGPVVVRVGFRLSEINDIDEENETFEFEGVLTTRWNDPRQTFDPAELGVEEQIYQGDFQFNEVFTGWWPQMILANESGVYERQGVLLRIQPDGSMTFVEAVNAVAKSRMSLKRFPFDRQRFEAIFGVLGFDKKEVVFEVDPFTNATRAVRGATIAQWQTPEVQVSLREYDFNQMGRDVPVMAFVVSLEMARRPGFMLRLVVFPLVVLVILSWSVFWMDRSSLGERMDISFLGILTIVAYQIMFSDILPNISYTTLIHVFLFITFVTMASSVGINLRVAHLDREGQTASGDLLDQRCRVYFPLCYFGFNALAAAYFFLVR